MIYEKKTFECDHSIKQMFLSMVESFIVFENRSAMSDWDTEPRVPFLSHRGLSIDMDTTVYVSISMGFIILPLLIFLWQTLL